MVTGVTGLALELFGPSGAHTERLFAQHLLSKKTTDDSGDATDDR